MKKLPGLQEYDPVTGELPVIEYRERSAKPAGVPTLKQLETYAARRLAEVAGCEGEEPLSSHGAQWCLVLLRCREEARLLNSPPMEEPDATKD